MNGELTVVESSSNNFERGNRSSRFFFSLGIELNLDGIWNGVVVRFQVAEFELRGNNASIVIGNGVVKVEVDLNLFH